MTNIPSISDAFEQIVTATEAAIIADTSLAWGTLPKKVYFMHGHPKEIVTRLGALTDGGAPFKNQKYPLVILVRDIEDEEPTAGSFGVDISFKAQIFICTLTMPNFRAGERETKNFKPILHPILYELLNQISLSNSFGMPTIDDMEVKWTDRYYWGADVVEKNKLNDYIDAVEIKTINLKLYNLPCSIGSNL